MDMDISGEEQRQQLINELAQEQAKDDLTKTVKPYIIKAADLKKELRRPKKPIDYRKALVQFMDDVLFDDIKKKRQQIAKVLNLSLKSVKRYLHDEGKIVL